MTKTRGARRAPLSQANTKRQCVVTLMDLNSKAYAAYASQGGINKRGGVSQFQFQFVYLNGDRRLPNLPTCRSSFTPHQADAPMPRCGQSVDGSTADPGGSGEAGAPAARGPAIDPFPSLAHQSRPLVRTHDPQLGVSGLEPRSWEDVSFLGLVTGVEEKYGCSPSDGHGLAKMVCQRPHHRKFLS